MYWIKIVVDNGTELYWMFKNRMDFEKWLDKLVVAYDNGCLSKIQKYRLLKFVLPVYG